MRIGKAISAAIATHAAIANAHHAPAAGRLTVAWFQVTPASGTFGFDPEKLNNNNTGDYAKAMAVDQYDDVIFPGAVHITQFRQWGLSFNNEDGRWTIQYMNTAGVWIDWVINLPTRAAETWSGWDSSGGDVVAIGIRIKCTTLDTGGSGSIISELEVKY